ncbi:hypothetical protein KU406_23240, partial [Salmonella enterica subsp. enterica serovar Montevideo]|nr:hypothetical protein [Salmonella enterica subsp. enterica serovar Montevideo]
MLSEIVFSVGILPPVPWCNRDCKNHVSEERVAEMIWDAVSEGATLKDVHGIPQDMMDGLYAHAYEF